MPTLCPHKSNKLQVEYATFADNVSKLCVHTMPVVPLSCTAQLCVLRLET